MTREQDLTSRHTRLDQAIVVVLLATAVFTALAHGAVEAWSLAVFELLVVGLMLLWGIRFIAEGRVALSMPAPGIPLAALVAFGLLQSLAFTDETGRRTSLSMDVEATRGTLLALFFLFVAFVIAANAFAGEKQKTTLQTFLVTYGLAMAVFALIQHFTWNGRFYWLRPLTSPAATPFGPFVNRNHFAGYMELLMPVPVGLLMTGAVRKDSRILYGFAATIMAVAAVASLSRGGIISLTAEMIFLAALASARRNREARDRKSSWPWALTALMAAAIAVGVFWIAAEPIVNRVISSSGLKAEGGRSETFYASRGWIWRDTLTMIEANPFVGVGLGAYETAYPIYSKDDGSITLGQSYAVDRAHNDYLQVLSDCGIVGLAIALWFIVVVLRAIWRGVNSRDALSAGLVLGCGAGFFGLLVHSIFDFNLQLPSNALLFLVFAAVISQLSAANSAPAHHLNDTRLELGVRS